MKRSIFWDLIAAKKNSFLSGKFRSRKIIHAINLDQFKNQAMNKPRLSPS